MFKNENYPLSTEYLLSDHIEYGGCLNTKMSSYQYRDPHLKDKMVSRR